MKYSKKILVVAMSIIMIIATIIPTFAVNYEAIYKYVGRPSDAGEQITNLNSLIDGNIHKIYMCIELSERPSSYPAYEINIKYLNTYTNTTTVTKSYYIQNLNNLINWGFSLDAGLYAFCYTGTFNTGGNYPVPIKLWIPVYLYNATIDNYDEYNNITYYTTTLSNQAVYQEGFQVGYDNGYAQGFSDSANYQQNLNLVEHCEQLLGTFVGDDYAHYITPLCLALVVILIYFLFIRWLLALVKSKNVTRVADIIVCTACIIMLVIMYAPMLDLTIHQAQTVYQITADTVVGG